MAVRIRMTKMGRTHRPYYRIVAADSRSPRDGKYIEAVGTYNPMIRDKEARVTLKASRVKHWLSRGAKPTEKVGFLLKKYLEKFEKLEVEGPGAETTTEQPTQPDKPQAKKKPETPPPAAETPEPAAQPPAEPPQTAEQPQPEPPQTVEQPQPESPETVEQPQPTESSETVDQPEPSEKPES